MAILFAAPFVLLAGIVFTLLSLIPRARKWAIPIPAGIIATGPTFITCLILGGLAFHVVLHDQWNWRSAHVVELSLLAVASILGGTLVAVAARFAGCILPSALLRIAVFVAGWCSYFVTIAGSLFFLDLRSGYSSPENWLVVAAIVSLEVILSFIGAWFIAQRSEEFRPARKRLPYGTSFRKRRDGGDDANNDRSDAERIQELAKRGSLEKFREILSRVPDAPPLPGDELPS